jgi:voltage-gated potassium channel
LLLRVKDVQLGNDYNLILVDREMGDNFIYSTEGHNHRLDEGDVLVVIGPYEEIDRIRQDLAH